jgi:hypothetical protein
MIVALAIATEEAERSRELRNEIHSTSSTRESCEHDAEESDERIVHAVVVTNEGPFESLVRLFPRDMLDHSGNFRSNNT